MNGTSALAVINNIRCEMLREARPLTSVLPASLPARNLGACQTAPPACSSPASCGAAGGRSRRCATYSPTDPNIMNCSETRSKPVSCRPSPTRVGPQRLLRGPSRQGMGARRGRAYVQETLELLRVKFGEALLQIAVLAPRAPTECRAKPRHDVSAARVRPAASGSGEQDLRGRALSLDDPSGRPEGRLG